MTKPDLLLFTAFPFTLCLLGVSGELPKSYTDFNLVSLLEALGLQLFKLSFLRLGEFVTSANEVGRLGDETGRLGDKFDVT